MSRIGRQPIPVPAGVTAKVDGNEVTITGPKGTLSLTVADPIVVAEEEGNLVVTRPDDERASRSLHGLTRTLVANMVTGVNEGFKRELEIQGVGFKANVQGKTLNLSLGKSHPILFPIPAEIKITVVDNTKITIEGIDNHVVGQCAADIRAFYPPEPYKGKGVRFVGEQIRRKEGKTVQ